MPHRCCFPRGNGGVHNECLLNKQKEVMSLLNVNHLSFQGSCKMKMYMNVGVRCEKV